MRERIASIVLGALVIVGLFFVKERSYLLFHCLAEIFTVIIACGIFMVAWNGRRFFDNNYLLFIGISFPSVAFIHVLHTLAYRGMGVFVLKDAQPAAADAYQANLATQLWIAGRYVQALSFLVAPILLRRRIRPALILGAYAALTGAVLASIFYWKVFPSCFVGGGESPSGRLTAFKVFSEYVIILSFVGAIVALFARKHAFDARVFWLLVSSMLFMAASDGAFTLYTDVYGPFNYVGHIFYIIAFYLIYKALIETALRRPYRGLFRNLKLSEDALKVARDGLERTVEERTSKLRSYQSRLRLLAAQLSIAEEEERRRIAQQLHDYVGQALAVAKIRLGALAATDPEGLDEPAADIRELIDQAIKYTRELTSELGSPVLYQWGLAAALEHLVEEFRDRHRISALFESRVETEIPKDNLSVLLFQACRELLFNIVKHAKAGNVRVALEAGEGRLTLAVEDDGVGLDLGAVNRRMLEKGGGFGLFSIRERLVDFGGHVRVKSAAGKGTRITLLAPLEGGSDAVAAAEADSEGMVL